jgi:hypothetical protein
MPTAAITASTANLKEIEATLEQAPTIATNCQREYRDTLPAIRHQIGQGFFRRLHLGQDGDVERYELTEPFLHIFVEHLRGPAPEPLTDRTRPSAVLARSFDLEYDTAPHNDLVRRGVN